MPGRTERVQVKMSPECKAVLKSYAETYGMTLGDALYRCTRLLFHRQANFCDFLEAQMHFNDIKVEGGSDKPCYGFMCNNCKMETPCRTHLRRCCPVQGRAEALREAGRSREHSTNPEGSRATLSRLPAEIETKRSCKNSSDYPWASLWERPSKSRLLPSLNTHHSADSSLIQ